MKASLTRLVISNEEFMAPACELRCHSHGALRTTAVLKQSLEDWCVTRRRLMLIVPIPYIITTSSILHFRLHTPVTPAKWIFISPEFSRMINRLVSRLVSRLVAQSSEVPICY
jgi:hypothetical protein